MKEWTTQIQSRFQGSAQNLVDLSSNKDLIDKIAATAETIVGCYKEGGCVFAAGNGGSAADAQHFVAELVSKLAKDRTPIKAFAMTVDTSILTATGNDYGYDLVFSRQVRANMTFRDILLAITTSGNSENIVQALQAAKSVGAKSILLSGKTGGRCADLADYVLLANGQHTAQIQEAHIVIYHCLCELIERGLVQAGLCEYV